MKISSTHVLAFIVFCFFTACTDGIDSGDPIVDEAGKISSAPDGTSTNPGNNESGVITAGEWNDLQQWDFWTTLMKNEDYAAYKNTWGFNPLKRYSFVLKGVDDKPIQDGKVIAKDASDQELWETHSDNFGKAELWPSLFNTQHTVASVIVSYRNQDFTFNNLKTFDAGINEITLPIVSSTTNSVDVMLVVDATGSMGDELEYLKKELYDVLERAQQTTGIKLRTGSVFYRDNDGDEYITRNIAFTDNISPVVKFVKDQKADGGGDFPEAVHSALQDAIQQQSWSSEARARLLFLMLDAPPHDTPDVKEQLKALIREASQKGIKIIPITASGIDKNTEFLMRFFSITTNGTYVFITNHSGIGNDHLQPTIGDYKVEYLNNLMVRLIRKYSE